MKQPTTQDAAIKDTKEEQGAGLGAALASSVTKLFGNTGSDAQGTESVIGVAWYGHGA